MFWNERKIDSIYEFYTESFEYYVENTGSGLDLTVQTPDKENIRMIMMAQTGNSLMGSITYCVNGKVYHLTQPPQGAPKLSENCMFDFVDLMDQYPPLRADLQSCLLDLMSIAEPLGVVEYNPFKILIDLDKSKKEVSRSLKLLSND